MIRLFAVNILPLKDEMCYKKCYLRSSQKRREQADTLQMPADKARCIAAGLLLEYAYQKFRTDYIKELAKANSFGYAPETLPEVKAGLRGKPEFVFSGDMRSEIYFNLSHSGDYVFCAMADFEVGVDIQKSTRVRESLLRRFFTEEEKKRMDLCGEDESLQERTFACIWATKEAKTKLTGRGIGQMLGQVLRDDDESTLEEREEYRLWRGVIDEEYAWAVASCPEASNVEPEGLEPVLIDGGELFYEGMF